MLFPFRTKDGKSQWEIQCILDIVSTFCNFSAKLAQPFSRIKSMAPPREVDSKPFCFPLQFFLEIRSKGRKATKYHEGGFYFLMTKPILGGGDMPFISFYQSKDLKALPQFKS